MSTLYQENSAPRSQWGLLLVDAKNAFNAMNRIGALWQARIHWPRCAKFLYNTYKGHAELVFRGSEEKLHSREGVTQGDPLAMLLYGISTLPLIDVLQDPQLTQCWYADDSSAQGHFDDLKRWWDKLNTHGPHYGYFPQGPKSYLVVHPADVSSAKQRFEGTGITIVTGQRFLGGYIGLDEGKEEFLGRRMTKWVECVKKFAMAGETQPQSAYAAFTKSVQFQWQYAQRVIDGGGLVYSCLRDAIWSVFLPAIVGDKELAVQERQLFSLPVAKGGLAVSDPVRSASLLNETSRAGSAELVNAIKLGLPLEIANHLAHLSASKHEAVKRRDVEEEGLLERTLAEFPAQRRRAISRAIVAKSKSKSSAWLTALPLKHQHFDLSASEFRDALSMRYSRSPQGLPSSCDGCGSPFSPEHALSCKTGGLISRRHNEVRDVFGELMNVAWGNCVKEPLIKEATSSSPGLRGDLACRGVWEPQRVALFDIRVTDTDAPSYISRTVSAVLSSAEQEKKRKYAPACEEQHASFTPLVCSVDGTWAPQAGAFIKVLAERLSDVWKRPQGVVRGWLRARLAFAVLRASSMCFRGARKRWRSAETLLGFEGGAALQVGL